MDEDGIEKLKQYDAIFLGAVGYPGVPDHISLWDLLLNIRKSFDQYVNLRPVRLLEGRTISRIQETLFISAGTVSTHIRHIYQKTGVDNRQELIDLAHETAAQDEAV